MAETALAPVSFQIDSYSHLRQAVKATLVGGQQELEAIKIKIYWQTGKLISDYLRTHPEEGKHGKAVIERLSRDLEIERSLFYRLLKFAEISPNVVTGPHLSWSHYRALLAVPDDDKRADLVREARKNRWPVMRLRKEIWRRQPNKQKQQESKKEMKRLLEPGRGSYGVREIRWIESLGVRKRLVADLGFGTYRDLNTAEAKTLSAGSYVVWDEQKNTWLEQGAKADRYYYKAEVERVIDGDSVPRKAA